MAAVRGKDGKFIKGSGGGPGRPPKKREERYLDILISKVTFADWEKIVQKAAKQAAAGNAVARKWLSDYLVGQPPQKHELSTKDDKPIFIVKDGTED